MQNKKIKLIVAVGKQNQIGLNGGMPWHLSDDLKNFKKLTQGNIVIMGRKTFESIGKALPNRLNFVVTSDPSSIASYEVCTFPSLEKALQKAGTLNLDTFIIGGATIYNQAIDKVDEMIITEVEYDGEADTFFPEIDFSAWKEAGRKKYTSDQKNNFDFDIITYLKIPTDEK